MYKLILLLVLIFSFPALINADTRSEPQVNHRPSIEYEYQGDHSFAKIPESSSLVVGNITFEWSIASNSENTGYIYVSDHNLSANNLYVPIKKRFNLGGVESGKHPCSLNENINENGHRYAHYFSKSYPPRQIFDSISTYFRVTSGDLVENNTFSYSPFEQGRQSPARFGFNNLSMGNLFGFNDGNGNTNIYDQSDAERVVIKFGTHKSECYSGIVYLLDNEKSMILAVDLKSIDSNNNLEIEYWVFYNPEDYNDVDQSLLEQIKNSPVYCDPKKAGSHGIGSWGDSIRNIAKRNGTVNYYNNCVGISFDFIPHEDAGTRPYLTWMDNTNLHWAIEGGGSSDHIAMQFLPLNCTYNDFNLQRKAASLNGRNLLETANQNYCEIEDYFLHQTGADNAIPLFKSVESFRNKKDLMASSFPSEFKHLETYNYFQPINYASSFNDIDITYCFLCIEREKIKYRISGLKRSPTEIIIANGEEIGWPVDHVYKIALFYTETHGVAIRMKMDKSEMGDNEREFKWEKTLINSLTIVPTVPHNYFQTANFDKNEKKVAWTWQQIFENVEDNQGSVVEEVVEKIFDSPFDLADRATGTIFGKKDNNEDLEEIKENVLESELLINEREDQLRQIELERQRMEIELRNNQDDFDKQLELQRLEIEAQRAQMELEMERLRLEQSRRELENPSERNQFFDESEYYSEEDRGFFSAPKIGSKKTDGGFENFSSDPTNLALLGLVVTVGTTIIQMFRGN